MRLTTSVREGQALTGPGLDPIEVPSVIVRISDLSQGVRREVHPGWTELTKRSDNDRMISAQVSYSS